MLINYNDKVQYQLNPLADEFQWSAADANHVKQVVNANQEEVENGKYIKYQGVYNASSNIFPSTGGTGTAGAIKGGNAFEISVSGILGGVGVVPGDMIIARIDAPGNTLGNWKILFSRAAGILRIAASVSAGAMNLNCQGQTQVKFENTTIISSAVNVTLSNETNLEFLSGIVLVTGAVPFTFPSAVIAEKSPIEPRFNNTSKILTLTGGVGEPFEMSLSKMNGPKYLLRAGYANHAA